jgi:hypothetical protein
MNLKSKIFYWYIAFVLVFICLTLIPTPDKATLAKYHLSPANARILDLTIIIPEAGIWLAAFYGGKKFHHYSRLLERGKDGPPIAKLSRGLLFLSFGLPITAIIAGLLNLIALHNPEFKTVTVIINNYVALVFPLLAFFWICLGARGLADINRLRPRFIAGQAVILSVITLGVVFCCLIVLNHRTLRTTYHMSPQLVMLTIGIPYMYIWYLGLSALADLRAYSLKLRGIVYRKGWTLLTSGLASIILLSILIQYLTTLASWLTSLSLSGLLLLLYGLLFLLAAAYIVVALGAQKLMKIEEA